VEQKAVEKQASPPGEYSDLESGLKTLWDRVRQAGETITRLRDERTGLENQVQELGTRLAGLERTLAQQQVTIRDLEKRLKEAPPPGDAVFANGEREVLAARLKELLARIEAYL
jgi:predicted  nucleic acid-binding Zn-ribbon protein